MQNDNRGHSLKKKKKKKKIRSAHAIDRPPARLDLLGGQFVPTSRQRLYGTMEVDHEDPFRGH